MNNETAQEEKRFSYNWPIWFAEDFNGILSQGQMSDISTKDASFTCYCDHCPFEGQQITARFSVPLYGAEGEFDMENLFIGGTVKRVENTSPFAHKVFFEFLQSLPKSLKKQVNTHTVSLTSHTAMRLLIQKNRFFHN